MGWQEIETAADEKRHELVLSGAEVSARIEKNGLDHNLYELNTLNFLEISLTGLNTLSDNLGNLSGLTNLVLRNNKLQALPSTIGKLEKLKMLDVSANCLDELPEEITQLSHLQSLNVSSNNLTELPCVSQLVELHILDLSHNKVEALPEGITDSSLTVLAQIKADGNQITEIPDDLYELPSLKSLNVSDNSLTEIPFELSKCLKLKELDFGGNKLKDRRLQKMGQQCQTKSILDYLSKSVSKKQQKEKETLANEKKKMKEVSKKERKKNRKVDQEVEDLSVDIMKVLHFEDEKGFSIQITENVVSVRPYIVCCVVRDLDFGKSSNLFKRFINLQTKLHDTVCQKRNAATIATHDLAATKSPLMYDARPPTNINITPLFRHKDVSANRLVAKLRQEADEQRKEKKRNQLSGIHKYLDLLKDKPLYPCLTDKDGLVISFPPITNCDATKISDQTTSMLLEVTSSASQEICKTIMDQLLQEMLQLGLGKNAESPSDDLEGAAGGEGQEVTRQQLVVEQVKILDTEGHMKVVYPSRVDLTSEGYKVIRDYE